MSHRDTFRVRYAVLIMALASACTGGCASRDPGETGSSGGGATGGGGAGGGSGSSSTGGGAAGGGTCDVPKVDIQHDTNAGSPGSAAFHLLDHAKYPLAVCNDGTQADYIFRPGVGKGVKRWIVNLAGGGSCGTSADCAARYAQTKGLMSNEGVIEGMVAAGGQSGMNSTDPKVNPDFYDANWALVSYCSSDAWTGDTAGDPALPTSDVKHWHFRGREIVKAVIADLLSRGMDQADEILLMGTSAGGYGTVMNADDVAKMIPASARYLALVDAGFFVDYPSYDPMTMTESTAMPTERFQQLSASRKVWGGRGDASCEAAANDDDGRALCGSPADVVIKDQISTRLFIRESQLDKVQIKNFIDSTQISAAAQAYRQRWAANMRQDLGQVPSQHAVFSPYDNQHGEVSDDGLWQTTTVDSLIMRNAVGAWYRDPCTSNTKSIQQP